MTARTPMIHLNGVMLPLSQASISPLDIGLLRGYAVFDLLRTIGGRPFLLPQHLTRLRASASQLDLTVPMDDAAIEAAITQLLAANAHKEATIRIVLTGGVSPDGMTFDPATPTFMILTHELSELPAEAYAQGARLVTQEHVREFPHAKTTNYLTMLKHRPRALAAGATDLLYHDGSKISEAASASVYFVRGGTILAPGDGVLLGTTGSFVLDLARQRHDVVAGDVSLDDAFAADEVFLTSTTRNVLPIVEIDGRRIGEGVPGPVTRDLMERFARAAFGS